MILFTERPGNTSQLEILFTANVKEGFFYLFEYLLDVKTEMIISSWDIVYHDSGKNMFFRFSDYDYSIWTSNNDSNPATYRYMSMDLEDLMFTRKTAKGYYKGVETELRFKLPKGADKLSDNLFNQGLINTRLLLDQADTPYTINIVKKMRWDEFYVINMLTLDMEERFEIAR